MEATQLTRTVTGVVVARRILGKSLAFCDLRLDEDEQLLQVTFKPSVLATACIFPGKKALLPFGSKLTLDINQHSEVEHYSILFNPSKSAQDKASSNADGSINISDLLRHRNQYFQSASTAPSSTTSSTSTSPSSSSSPLSPHQSSQKQHTPVHNSLSSSPSKSTAIFESKQYHKMPFHEPPPPSLATSADVFMTTAYSIARTFSFCKVVNVPITTNQIVLHICYIRKHLLR